MIRFRLDGMGVGRLPTVWASLALVLFGSGCFLATEPFETPAPSALEGLEADVRSDSTDLRAVTRVAASYAVEGELEGARRLLLRTEEKLPGDPALLAMLGVVEEELGLYDAAAARYSAYLEGRGGPYAELIHGRLDGVRPLALRARARGILGLSELTVEGADEPVDVVVLPVAHSGEDQELASLAAGLTWLLGRDLSSGDVRVADRLLVGSLVEQMDVAPPQRDETSLAVRVGEILGAEHVIQGRLRGAGPGRFSWNVAVMTLAEDGFMDLAPVPVEGRVEDMLRLQATVRPLLQRSIDGEPLIPARDRDAVPSATSDVEAFLEFGRGLEAAAGSDWATAETAFRAARELDPSFEEAGRRVERATRVRAATETPLPRMLEEGARVGDLQRAVASLRRGPGSGVERTESRIGSRDREVVSEVLGLDRIGGGLLLEIIFTLPGGSQP